MKRVLTITKHAGSFLVHLLCLLLLPLLLSSCSITDGEVRKEINDRGGVEITAGSQIGLEGEQGSFLVKQAEPSDTSFTDPSIKFVFQGQQCTDYCWVQVLREYLDDGDKLVPITEFTKLTPELTEIPRARRERMEQRNVDGYVVDSVDLNLDACSREFSGSRSFFDSPNFNPLNWENNEINSRARLFVIEYETCFRCRQPPTGYLGCIKWYYVRVKGDPEGLPERVFLVTANQVQPAPSDQFNRAVERWERP